MPSPFHLISSHSMQRLNGNATAHSDALEHAPSATAASSSSRWPPWTKSGQAIAPTSSPRPPLQNPSRIPGSQPMPQRGGRSASSTLSPAAGHRRPFLTLGLKTEGTSTPSPCRFPSLPGRLLHCHRCSEQSKLRSSFNGEIVIGEVIGLIADLREE
nr:uncharacterized protein LOC107282000 [Oryza sativa Japonica Group]